jgi:hypothetical protein
VDSTLDVKLTAGELLRSSKVVTRNEQTIKVGSYEPKEVSKLNHHLFKEAKSQLADEANLQMYHIGWYGIGIFIDWLESNYNITPRGKGYEQNTK